MKKLLLTTLMAVSAVFGYSQTPYWSYSFSGGSLVDDAGNDDLTQTGSALTTVSDRFSSADNAVSLNGDVLEGGTYNPSAPVDHTYSLWVKDAVNESIQRTIIDHFGTVSFGNSVRLENGLIQAVVRPGYYDNSNWVPDYSETYTLSSTTTVDDGNWHHVVLTVDQNASQPRITDYELYIDGTLEDDATATMPAAQQLYRPYRTPSPFLIGDNVAGVNRYENSIDDISFYGQALNQTQVTALYNARPPQVVYVDQDATGAGDGSSWADAFTDIQSALSFATIFGDTLWIAEGVYKPDASDRTVFYTIPAGMGVYGGFNGTETSLSQRDWHTYETVLSGDLNGDDDNSNIGYIETTRSDNSYRIMYIEDDDVVIDGLVFQGGQANDTFDNFGSSFDRGSTIFKDENATNVTIRHSTFRYNVSRVGNAFFEFATSGQSNSVLIESCDFYENFSLYGAGITSVTNASGAVTDFEVYNSRFYKNVAGDIPGRPGYTGSSFALFANQGTINATLVNNTFAYNQEDGSNVANDDVGTVVLRRLDNSASDVINLELHNNIFFGNKANNNLTPGTVALMNRPNNLINSMNLSNNVLDVGPISTNAQNITIEGSTGNLSNADPDFIDGPNGDLRLTSSSWVVDQGNSSKLPASITKDVGGEDRILNSTIDFGAHEFNPALCSPPVAINTQPLDETACPGDDNVTFSVAAAGNNLSYQWQLDGTDISGETGSSLTLNAVGPNDDGDYTVVVSDACNDVTSSAASLSVLEYTAFNLVVLGPTDVCEGDDFTTPDLANTTQGDNLSYQWSYDGVQLNGETGSSFSLTNVQLSDAGDYSVEATGTCGTDQLTFPVNVIEPPEPVITENMGTLETGAYDYYWWYLDGVEIASGATAETVAVGAPGDYTVEVNLDGCTGESAPYTANPVGINEADGNDLKAYPNPFTDELTVELSGFSGQVDVQILDMTGRIVMVTNATGDRTQMNLSELSKGSYMMVIRGANGQTSQRRLIKN